MLIVVNTSADVNQGEKIMGLYLVALGAFGLGGFAGFVFAAFGEEKQSFGNVATVLNGLLGGFALSDLTKNDSAIKAVFKSMATACAVGSGWVACVAVFFGALGFVAMYVNKQYLLNPALAQSSLLAEQNKALAQITRSIRISQTEFGVQPRADQQTRVQLAQVIEEFKRVTDREPALMNQLSIETLKAYSKGYYVLGNLAEAEKILRQARQVAPDEPDVLFYLAHVLITADRPLEAIPYLLYLAALPNTSVITWKMLGYACLFDPNRLDEADRATSKYLKLFPDDSGALLNLACVFGQRGPTPENEQQVKEKLGRAIQINPSIAPFVKDTLTKPGQDFAAWVEVDSFRKQVGL